MRAFLRRRAVIVLIALSVLLAGCGALDPTAVTGGQLEDILQDLVTSFEDGSDLSPGTEAFMESVVLLPEMIFGGP